MKARLLLGLLAAAVLCSCVYVAREGSYTRTDNLDQSSTNGNNRNTRIEIPKL